MIDYTRDQMEWLILYLSNSATQIQASRLAARLGQVGTLSAHKKAVVTTADS
jgi:hypothetical protein